MTPFTLPTGDPRLRVVDSFEALLATPFADGISALCWPRELAGNFGEVVALLPAADCILPLDEATLEALSVSHAGRIVRPRGPSGLGGPSTSGVNTGQIAVFADNLTTPFMTANDTTFPVGRAGFGSQDDPAEFRRVTVTGEQP